MRSDEKRDGKQWSPLFFRSRDDLPEFQQLAQSSGVELQPERTKGVWLFDREAYEVARRPFRGGLTPDGSSEAASTGDGQR